jgi:predicted secreted protein
MIMRRSSVMKKTVILGLVFILVLPLLIVGCQNEKPAEQTTPTGMPSLNGGEEAKTIEISTDDFMAQKNIVKDIEITRPGSLIVSLGSNPTTGFQWGENATINTMGGQEIVVQASHNYVEPKEGEEPVMGAPGKDVWVFDSKNPGTATINFSYSRPWEGGEKDEWTLTINVTVK